MNQRKWFLVKTFFFPQKENVDMNETMRRVGPCWGLGGPWRDLSFCQWGSTVQGLFRKKRGKSGGWTVEPERPLPLVVVVVLLLLLLGVVLASSKPLVGRGGASYDGSISLLRGGRRRGAGVLLRPLQRRRAARGQGVRGAGVHRPRALLRLQRAQRVRQGPRYLHTRISPLSNRHVVMV